MEEWSYQQRSDEGLGSGQDKHKPAQKELQQHTHTHTFMTNSTYMYKCTNTQTHEAASTLYPSCTYIYTNTPMHARMNTHTHTCRKINSYVWLPDHSFLSVKLCDNRPGCHFDISFHHIVHISPFAQIPLSKHEAKRNGWSFIFKHDE